MKTKRERMQRRNKKRELQIKRKKRSQRED
jgi:hypothetical protein